MAGFVAQSLFELPAPCINAGRSCSSHRIPRVTVQNVRGRQVAVAARGRVSECTWSRWSLRSSVHIALRPAFAPVWSHVMHGLQRQRPAQGPGRPRLGLAGTFSLRLLLAVRSDESATSLQCPSPPARSRGRAPERRGAGYLGASESRPGHGSDRVKAGRWPAASACRGLGAMTDHGRGCAD